MEKIKSQKLSISNIIFGLSGILFIFYLFASFFVFPSGDDYSYALRSIHRASIWQLQVSYYIEFCGRYFATLLTHLFVGLPKFYSFSFVSPFLVVLSVFLSALFMFKVIADRLNYKNKKLHIWAALLFTTAYFISLPNPAQSLYWITGAHVYMLPMTLLFLSIGLVFLPHKSNLQELFIHLGLALSCFAFSGCNEINAFLGGTILFFVLILFWKNRSTHAYYRLLTSFFATTLGLLLIMAAPGNNVRMEYAGGIVPANFVLSLISATKATTVFLLKQNFFYPPIMIFFTIFMLLFFFKEHQNKKLSLPKYTGNIFPIVLPLLLIAYIMLSSPFLTAWGGYAEPPQRMYSIPLGLSWPLLVLLAFNLASYFAQYKLNPKKIDNLFNKTAYIICLILIFIAIKFMLNSVKFPDYNNTMRTRYRLLEQMQDKKDLTVYVKPPVRPWPVYNEDVLSVSELKQYPSHDWKNGAAAEYFGLKMLYAQEYSYHNFWDIQSTDNLPLLYLITFLANSGLFFLYFLLIYKDLKLR